MSVDKKLYNEKSIESLSPLDKAFQQNFPYFYIY